MPIHVLAPDLAAKIAAGEVIERPASVVKELIENALDAGAQDIRIEVRGGGQRLIRVADDGSGIPSDQVELAFARHGTSKIESTDDLFAIKTLGFRGEALPSIAAVARVTLITRARDESNGTLFKIENSHTLAHQPHGAPRGAVVTVEDLFRSIPARLKFLKSPGAEAARIAELINAYALAYPQVRFSLVNDGRLLFQTGGSGRRYDVLLKVLGADTAREMIELRTEDERRTTEDEGRKREDVEFSNNVDNPSSFVVGPSSVSVQGYVSPPSVHRATRKTQYLFINGRWIEDRSLSHAIVEAYHTLLMVGRFPLFVVDVRLPAEAVDVNAHPTKAQVRFRDPGEVYRAVQRSVRRALTTYLPVPSLGISDRRMTDDEGRMTNDERRSTDIGLDLGLPNVPRSTSELPSSVNRPPPDPSVSSVVSSSSILRPPSMPMLRVLGQIASTYIICEGPDGMYLVDQHAAHERVLYENWQNIHSSGSFAQELLEPIPVNLSPTHLAIYEQERVILEQAGFRTDPFGGQTILLRAVPSVLKNRDPQTAFLEILDATDEGGAPLVEDAEARVVKTICKSAAIKGGQVLALEEMRALIRDLEKSRAPRTCPHGRPTMIQLDLAKLEREFGRRG